MISKKTGYNSARRFQQSQAYNGPTPAPTSKEATKKASEKMWQEILAWRAKKA